MTTSSPKLAVEIFEKAKEKGLKALDAPVTGGDIGAKNGTLTILVGGEEEDYKACLPIFFKPWELIFTMREKLALVNILS